MNLADELLRAAGGAAGYGAVRGILPAEPNSLGRSYLIALGDDEERAWLVLDARFEPVSERVRVREVASIVVLCELAVELAGGGRLGELELTLEQLAAGRSPVSVEAVRDAAGRLEQVIGVPPQVASTAYLDRIGAATRRLEQELGDHESPLARALLAHASTVEGFIAEVESRHAVPLR